MRLRRIEGQIRGIQRMTEKEAPCSEILTQVGAVTAAMKRAGMVILQSHMEECLEKAAQKTGNQQKEALRDFQKAISRYINWA